MVLRLPNSYVEVDKDEMEYVDGGMNVVNTWYGHNLNFSERETQILAKILMTVGAGACAYGAIAAAFPALGWVAGGVTCAVGACVGFAGLIIDLADYIGGSNGLSIKCVGTSWTGYRAVAVWGN